MAEAIATQSWDNDRFSCIADSRPFQDDLDGLRKAGDTPCLIYLSHGTLVFLVHGRSIFATAPALIQIMDDASVEITSSLAASGKYWTFKSPYKDTLCDIEGLTVTPFETALEAARIGGHPITVATTRHGVLAVADQAPADWECMERFHIRGKDLTSETRAGMLLWSARTLSPDDQDSIDLAIVGAGPTGLSVAAWAHELGLSYRIFGEPLSFWKRHIAPLPLRSPPLSTNISTPRQGYRFMDFAQRQNIDTQLPVSMAAFLAYASWFSEEHEIHPRPAVVKRLGQVDGHWTLDHSGEKTRARNVVVSIGLQTMQRRPIGLDAIEAYWSFVSDVLDFSPLSGKRVAVLGAGQSAIEAALLAAQAGASVTLVIRGTAIHYRCLHTPGEWIYRNLFKQSRHFIAHLPGTLQDRLLRYLLKGTVETSLESVVDAADIRVLPQARIGVRSGDDPRPSVVDPHGAAFDVDHVLVATGYDYDVRRIPFLGSIPIRQRNGLPLLDRYAMASAPGLFFSGLSTARRFGPQAQFVFGTGIVSPQIMQGVIRRASA